MNFGGAPALDLSPAGPVSDAFRKCWPRGVVVDGEEVGGGVKLISGPQGGGKTTQVFLNMFNLACMMPISPIDGIRRFKLVTVTEDLGDAWDKTRPSWLTLFPEQLGHFSGSRGRKFSHRLPITLLDGSRLLYDAEFDGFGNDKSEAAIETFFRGLQPTCIFLNELSGMPQHALRFALGRCGRYPHAKHGLHKWFGVVGDFNKPSQGHWLYKVCVEEKIDGLEYFEQPDGLGPDYENKAYLQPGYYQAQAAINGIDSDWTTRMIRNRWGVDPSGKVVYPTYRDDRHFINAPFEFDPELSLIIGTDAGRRPAAVFLQRTASGQFRLLFELFIDGIDGVGFGRAVNRALKANFPGVRPAMIEGWGDPASDDPTEGSDTSHMRMVSDVTGITFRPAPGGNELEQRIAVVAHVLDEVLPDGQPGLILSNQCPLIRQGFLGSYKFPRIGTSGADDLFHPKPLKNKFSHPHDALQNALKGAGVLRELEGRRQTRASFRVPAFADTRFSVYD